jgi:cation-transporting P-type ATPase 13A2
MQNKLKPVSTGVIETLNNANIRTIMATGDNVLTAVSVGRECSIIDAETEVFLGELRNDGGMDQIYWKST